MPGGWVQDSIHIQLNIVQNSTLLFELFNAAFEEVFSSINLTEIVKFY